MNIEELLQKYPLKRIKPMDGLAVTAKVWDEAHDYHRRSHGIHALFNHGSGILAGLEVIASDPPDTSVYILPGIAIDPAGQMIVLAQPVAYSIGQEMEGLLYILLTYGESRARRDNGDGQEGGPLYMHAEFSIAASTMLANTPWVELARVRRSSRSATFSNAPNFFEPTPDQIDLRFRREINAAREVNVVVCYLGPTKDNKAGRGANYLAQALNYQGRYRLQVDDGAVIGPTIVSNTLVYLVGQGSFELEPGLMNGLRNYVQRAKGTLLLEGLDAKAEQSFDNFVKAINISVAPPQAGHPLLTRPNLFAAPPPGYETQGESKFLVGDGLILSGHKYGLVWQGERSGRLASREEIRSALEWGGNIMAYAEARRRMSGQR